MQSYRLVWVGGEHSFLLTLGNLRALQDACNAGPNEIYERIRAGTWRIDDLFETIRQGLIGGGMAVDAASELTTRLFNQHPLDAFTATALSVIIAALVGVDDDQPGELSGETPPPENGVSQ